MIDTVRPLRIFIASPGDCILEREAVRCVCREDQTILEICRKNHISVKDFGWEDICSDVGRPQSIINAAVEKFSPDWFIFIFWHRFGSDAGLGMTGTEEEWNLARRLNEYTRNKIGLEYIRSQTVENSKYALPDKKAPLSGNRLKQNPTAKGREYPVDIHGGMRHVTGK